ncbi:uncharacterized protein [Diabrotica undecimpunctata]|uniref:uncharacterized protein n=1 Tax=Diabrotica undecimpunctata TaxID=50387 RepID=UPI003B63F857
MAESLVRKRGNIKAKLTNFSKFMDNINIFEGKINDEQLLIELESRLSRAERLLDEFEEIEGEIGLLDEKYNSESEIVNFENLFYKTISKTRKIVNDSRDLPNSNDSQSVVSEVHGGGLKLNYLQFRYQRLMGDATKVLQKRQTTSVSYNIVWKLLCDRYDDTPMLVDFHLDALLLFPNLVRESADQLRNMLDTITETLLTLEKLNISVQSWDPIVIHCLTKKFDDNTFRCWEEKRPKGIVATLDEFKAFLNERVDTLKNIERNSKKVKENKGKCGEKHHTLLHYDTRPNTETGVGRPSGNKEYDGVKFGEGDSVGGGGLQVGTSSSQALEVLQHVGSVVLDNGIEVPGEILLSTALIQVMAKDGSWQTCRVLLDSGSQPNLITSELATKLDLQQDTVTMRIFGINQKSSGVSGRCIVSFKSIHSSFQKTISCLVVAKICGFIPSQNLNTCQLDIPPHLSLADAGFGCSAKVDMLLGAEIFYSLLCVGQIKLSEFQPILQKTLLGWILAGPMQNLQTFNSTMCNLNVVDIQNQLEKFFLEEIPQEKQALSVGELECERMFVENTKREKDGKFIVRIPFKEELAQLGDSKLEAKNRFLALERRLEKNVMLKGMYDSFMNEYISLGHMSLSEPSKSVMSYYLPYHGVLNENSSTTKLRVVFNGSMKTNIGVSLNDIQHVGPKLQEDLVLILLRFRQHAKVICADVAKMYRMIWVSPNQRSLQKIFWRSSPSQQLEEYTLNTVTYGTRSAPYLAIRCLRQLGMDGQKEYPKAAEVILRDFYVDDVLTGAETAGELLEICNQMVSILKAGGMELRKWVSNDVEVQRKLDSSVSVDQVHFGEKEQNKTLGLYWKFRQDELLFEIDFLVGHGRHIKRNILSDVSKIFDPLGLVAPSVVLAKIMLQKLWKLDLKWDESLPCELNDEWSRLKSDFILLNKLAIPRQVVCSGATVVDIHGFCDASINAYGCCIYLRSVNECGDVSVKLLCAKVRVAPLKSLTIPRLELCGALLLSKLAAKVKQAMTINFRRTVFWCDSTVVLSWIKMSPSDVQVFVGNRISQIQELTDPKEWRHVRTDQNPADIVSRGIFPSKLVDCQRWWCGPDWLGLDEQKWPNSVPEQLSDMPETRVHVGTCQNAKDVYKFPFHIFGHIIRIKRSLAYCLRYFKISCIKTHYPVL